MTDSSPGSVDVPPTPAPERADAEPGAADAQPAVVGQAGAAALPTTAEAAGPDESPTMAESPGGDGSESPGPADEPAPEPVVAPPVAGDFRMALVSSVTVDLPNQHPSVVLRESESPRRQLTFSIAFHDAVVLSHALRRIPTPRPLTHELVSGIIQRFDIDVVAVRLVGRQGSIYFAELDLMGRNGRSVHSCRPSDALTVALLQPVPVPILIDRRLFEQVGDVTPPG